MTTAKVNPKSAKKGKKTSLVPPGDDLSQSSSSNQEAPRSLGTRFPGVSGAAKAENLTASRDCPCLNGGDGSLADAPGIPRATCLDQASGLYHPQHFELSLKYEFSRMERTEKPLGLILLRLDQPTDTDLQNLSHFLLGSLRPLDLAARLPAGEVVVLIPEADRNRATRLLLAIGQAYAPGGFLHGPVVVFGAAIARPYQSGGPFDLVVRARNNVGTAEEVAAKILAGSSPWREVNTALDKNERDSLFDGFGSLSLAGSSRKA
jgi:GGDEF domain-containing protein